MKRDRGQRRRLTRLEWALLVSLVLHGLFVLALLRRVPVARVAAVHEGQPIEVVIREIEEAPPEVRPTPPPPREEKREVPPPPPRPLPQAAERATASDDDSEPLEYGDEPAPSMLPDENIVGLPKGMQADVRGHTVHNAPGEVPDAVAVRAEREAVGRARVQGMLDGEVATQRVKGGMVSPYFASLRRELTAGIVHPPEIFDPNQSTGQRMRDWVHQLKASSQGSWQRYGATGAAYAEPDGYRADLEIPSKLAELARGGEPHARAFAQNLYAGARLRQWANGAAGIDLDAVVELRQDAGGALVSAELLEPSGIGPFDTWVLEMAKLSVDNLKEAPPDAGVGIHPEGLRTVWHYKGKVSYMRSSKEFDAKQDAWYLMAMAPLGLAPGTFDEVSGTMSYVDFRYPHYEATVTLLQVY